MDAICLLLFKPGFTIMPLKDAKVQPQYFGKFLNKFNFRYR